VGLIATSLPISNDVDVNREITYTATLRLPSGGFVKGTVWVDDITDPGILWIGPAFVDGVTAPGSAVQSPAVTYATVASLAADITFLIDSLAVVITETATASGLFTAESGSEAYIDTETATNSGLFTVTTAI